MNKKKTAVVLSLIIVSLLSVFTFVSVSAYNGDDPLITLSYIKEILLPDFKEEIMQEVDEMVSDISYDPDSLPVYSETKDEPVDTDSLNNGSQADATYTLLELEKGQTVMAESICEFIVRPGSNVSAISPFPAQGIADITNGTEVLDGETISINAYCLIPRGSDGRGMTVLSEKAYIMIRGDYTIG